MNSCWVCVLPDNKSHPCSEQRLNKRQSHDNHMFSHGCRGVFVRCRMCGTVLWLLQTVKTAQCQSQPDCHGLFCFVCYHVVPSIISLMFPCSLCSSVFLCVPLVPLCSSCSSCSSVFLCVLLCSSVFFCVPLVLLCSSVFFCVPLVPLVLLCSSCSSCSSVFLCVPLVPLVPLCSSCSSCSSEFHLFLCVPLVPFVPMCSSVFLCVPVRILHTSLVWSSLRFISLCQVCWFLSGLQIDIQVFCARIFNTNVIWSLMNKYK